MSDLHDETRMDLRRVVGMIETLTGLQSRWSGTLRVRDLDFAFSGQKHRSCEISIRRDVLASPAYRWATMIHEGLHSVSGAFTASQPEASSDQWEEAIVEQVQRLLRPTILGSLVVEVSADELAVRDGSHLYNQQIRRLETVRERLRQDALPFYLSLLAGSTRERARTFVDAIRGPQRGEGGES